VIEEAEFITSKTIIKRDIEFLEESKESCKSSFCTSAFSDEETEEADLGSVDACLKNEATPPKGLGTVKRKQTIFMPAQNLIPSKSKKGTMLIPGADT